MSEEELRAKVEAAVWRGFTVGPAPSGQPMDIDIDQTAISIRFEDKP